MNRLVALMLALAACHHTRKTLVPDVPQTGDPHARARFLDAKAKFLRDGTSTGAGAELARIVEEFPQDPIAPWAELYAGIAALKAHDFRAADAQLAKVVDGAPEPGLVARGKLFLGIAKNYEGDPKRARELLAGAERAVEGDDERTEFVAAVAYSTALGDRPLAALSWLDELYPRVTPAERAVIVGRVEELVAAADDQALRRAYDELAHKDGPAGAVAGSRLLRIAEQTGDVAGVTRLQGAVAAARVAVGLPRTISDAETPAAGPGNADPSLIGSVLPLGSARENGLAERAAQGLALAAGAPDGKGIAAVEARAIPDKAAAQEMVDELARTRAIAIVGPIGGGVDAAAGRAEALGVPLISLSPHSEQAVTGRFVFHIRHSNESRARELARRAIGLGVKKLCVMRPESEYGETTAGAFAQAAQLGGASIVATITYPTKTVSFAGLAKKVAAADCTGVFVADEAEKLGLLAPALAAAGAVPSQASAVGTKKPKHMTGQPVLLMSTAEDLKAGYLAAAGRHSEGALLAPGFYPDDADPADKPFVDRFVAAYGRPPGATEAYAFDAAQLVASAGAGGRAALAQALGKGQLVGVTGTLRFDSEHRRADPGIVYTVVEETGGQFAIRVAR